MGYYLQKSSNFSVIIIISSKKYVQVANYFYLRNINVERCKRIRFGVFTLEWQGRRMEGSRIKFVEDERRIRKDWKERVTRSYSEHSGCSGDWGNPLDSPLCEVILRYPEI